MAAWKRQRTNDACSAMAPIPADLMLEIAVRSDAITLVRCAAACRILRRRILTAASVQEQVFPGVLTQYVLACLHARRNKRRHHRPKPLVSLVYPATHAASSLVSKGLAPFVSRRVPDLLRQYEHVTSRRGLIVLRRRSNLQSWKSCGSNLCVYDPMTDARTFLSKPTGINMDSDMYFVKSCVLLTAADGIGCGSFRLLVASMDVHPTDSTMRVQTSAPSDAGDISWGPVAVSGCHSGWLVEDRGLVVLPGGVIHWLTLDWKILRYDVRTGKLDIVEHPAVHGKHHLAVSSAGRLRILAVEGFMIDVWEQLSAGGWSRHARINTEEKLRSMHPKILIDGAGLRRSQEIRSNAVLLHINDRIIDVLDLETKDIRRQENSTSSFFFEVDLRARLQVMRKFT